jgi:predicted helicase
VKPPTWPKTPIQPQKTAYFHASMSDLVNNPGYEVWQNGIKTDRDELFVDSERDALATRMKTFFSEDCDETFKNKYRVFDSTSYGIVERRQATSFEEANIRRLVYRPFDTRWIYYERGLTSRPAWDVMRHMLADNRCLLASRQQGTTGFYHAFCASLITDHSILSVRSKEITSVFPLYLHPASDQKLASHTDRRPNLTPAFLKALAEKLRVPQEGPRALPKAVTPEDVFHYAYAVFHSPTYRTRYAEFLKIDFPRLPLTSDVELFRALAAKGADLVALHLLESPKVEDFLTDWPVKGDNVMEKVQYTEKDHRVWINKTQCFGGVPKAVWEFHIGGYQVCHKWLKDRKGRKLTYDDTQHYQKVVVALSETIRLMAEIDEVIAAHGGWPMK